VPIANMIRSRALDVALAPHFAHLLPRPGRRLVAALLDQQMRAVRGDVEIGSGHALLDHLVGEGK
jgi:hypothetical protein